MDELEGDYTYGEVIPYGAGAACKAVGAERLSGFDSHLHHHITPADYWADLNERMPD
jgi:hypothetical protein